MIGFAEKVLSYTEGRDQDSFLAHDLTHDATLRNLELIDDDTVWSITQDNTPQLLEQLDGIKNQQTGE